MTRSCPSNRPTRRAFLGLSALAMLAACGQREGGRGWSLFGGRDDVETLEPKGGYNSVDVDPRPLAPRVDTMVIEPVAGGVIVRATGVMPSQDFWDAKSGTGVWRQSKGRCLPARFPGLATA